MPYFMVNVQIEIEADDAECATRAVRDYINHIMASGPDVDLVAPESMTVEEAYEV